MQPETAELWRGFAQFVRDEFLEEIAHLSEMLQRANREYARRGTECMIYRLDKLERLDLYESRLQKKLERHYAMLFTFQQRRGGSSGSFVQNVAAKVITAKARPMLPTPLG